MSASEIAMGPETSFELERTKRTIHAINDLDLLKHLACQMAEMMAAQKTVFHAALKHQAPR